VELCEREGIRPAPYVGRYKWVLVERLDVLDDEELEDLIRQSYEMVVAKGKGPAGAKVGKVKGKGGNHPPASLRAGSGHEGHEGKSRSRQRG
jgi:hypothetical protein